jgi:hypothetical protein
MKRKNGINWIRNVVRPVTEAALTFDVKTLLVLLILF